MEDFPDITRSGLFGGSQGRSFDDSSIYLEGKPKITELRIFTTTNVQGIHVIYENGVCAYHGGLDGEVSYVNLADDEEITLVEGNTGDVVSSITFQSSAGIRYGPYGEENGDRFRVDFGGNGLKYIFGKESSNFDSIGFAYGPTPVNFAVTRSPMYGSSEDYEFDGERVFNEGQPRITAISVWGYTRVMAVTVNYENGVEEIYGDPSGRPDDEDRLELAAGENIVSASGKAVKGGVIHQLTFKTSKDRSVTNGQGKKGKDFAVDFNPDGSGGKLVFLFGYAGRDLNGIGFGFGKASTSSAAGTKRFERPRWVGTTQNEIFDHFAFTEGGQNQIRTIKVWYDEREVRGIDVMYDDGSWTGPIGGETGDPVIFQLSEGEFLTAVHGIGEEWIQAIYFMTSKGRTSPLYGPFDDGKPKFEFNKKDAAIVALCGRQDTYKGWFGQLGVVYMSGVIAKMNVLSLKYHTDNMLVNTGKPNLVGRQFMKNNTKIDQEMSSSISHTSTTTEMTSSSSSFSKSVKFGFGAFGHAIFGGAVAGFSIGKNFSESMTKSSSVSTSKERTNTFIVRVQPGETVEAKAYTAESTVTIPYTMVADVTYLGSMNSVQTTMTGSYTTVSTSDMQMEYEEGVEGIVDLSG